MKKKLINLCILLSLLLAGNYAISQVDCGTTVLSTSPVLTEIGGYLKPERTDLTNGIPSLPSATFKMLFVFVQFQGEGVQGFTEWPVGGAPTYINSLLAVDKVTTGNYWDRYNSQTQLLSDYYMEVSRGTLDVTGITRNIIMESALSDYTYTTMLNEIYSKLAADQTINWYLLDQWRKNQTTGLFENETDNYIDMIGLFFRTVTTQGIFTYNAAGYVPLGGPAYPLPNGKLIGTQRDEFGSGFVCMGNSSPNGKSRNLGIAIHEIGHYLYGGVHSTSGIMTSRGGISINDFFYSGFERMKLGYVTANTVNYNFNNYQLDDVSGRDGTTNLIMKVPINSNEFFLIENRRKISQYDVYMLGDTVRGEPIVIDALDKGKGVYIYHSMSGNNYASNVDLECADGLWDWTNQGYTTPDWSSTQQVPIIARNVASNPVNNDDSYWGSLYGKDGVSAEQVFFTLGKRHSQVGQSGTVIKYTNTPDWYTSRETWGDRYDSWNIGYNEVFSPYSNPNTKDQNNGQTGIFIYYSGLSNNKANINIYKVGENGMTEADILALTPPSKPMGIKHDFYYPEYGWCVPKITWYHNLEPDMLRKGNIQRYEVYRATASNMNYLPDENNYILIATVDIPISETPHYEDYSVLEYNCAELDQVPPFGIEYPVRYRVKAIDKTNTPSVLSDYVYTTGINEDGGIPIGGGNDNPEINQNKPKDFNLMQNFPNPFNPTTKINFALPKQGFVTLKIYDITGREIQTLVNEVKQAGYYSVDFNGSALASGVYFYKIQSNDFVSVKRMVLIK